MGRHEYVFEDDIPWYQRVPWWGWALVVVAVAVLLSSRGGSGKDDFRDYLA